MRASSCRALRIAVIGCGRIATSHLAAVAESDLAILAATVDEDMTRARAAASKYGAGAAYGSTGELYAQGDAFDAVIICLPNQLHASASIEAAGHRKHILLEKPMANTARDAWAMVDAAGQGDVTLAIAQRRRHYRAVRHLLDNIGDFGRLLSAQVSLGVRFERPQAPWWTDADSTGDLVMGLNAPHCLDFLQAVMGTDPLRVSAEGIRSRDIWGGYDEAMILLAYPEARLASVHVSFNQFPSEDRKVLVFDKGTVELRNDRQLSFNGELLITAGEDESSHYLDEAVEFRKQVDEFVLAIRGLPNNSVPMHAGARLVETIEATRRALRDRQVISPESNAHGR